MFVLCIGEVSSASDVLISLAHDRGFSVRSVPGDGNCLFHSVQMQLETLGIQLDHQTMREQLVEYFEDHPYTHDGSCHLRNYLPGAVGGQDTEPADEEDSFISSVTDDDTRQQLRWCKYLNRLRSDAWGDHMAVQGLADMLHVDIHIIATLNCNIWNQLNLAILLLEFCTLV